MKQALLLALLGVVSYSKDTTTTSPDTDFRSWDKDETPDF
jgi:hypothetical protein